jgi:hypothetical protein
MKKAVWITFFVALVLVNLGAWIAAQFTGFTIGIMFRLVLVLSITVVASVFVGANLLIKVLERERPLTGPGRTPKSKATKDMHQ